MNSHSHLAHRATPAIAGHDEHEDEYVDKVVGWLEIGEITDIAAPPHGEHFGFEPQWNNEHHKHHPDCITVTIEPLEHHGLYEAAPDVQTAVGPFELEQMHAHSLFRAKATGRLKLPQVCELKPRLVAHTGHIQTMKILVKLFYCPAVVKTKDQLSYMGVTAPITISWAKARQIYPVMCPRGSTVGLICIGHHFAHQSDFFMARLKEAQPDGDVMWKGKEGETRIHIFGTQALSEMKFDLLKEHVKKVEKTIGIAEIKQKTQLPPSKDIKTEHLEQWLRNVQDVFLRPLMVPIATHMIKVHLKYARNLPSEHWSLGNLSGGKGPRVGVKINGRMKKNVEKDGFQYTEVCAIKSHEGAWNKIFEYPSAIGSDNIQFKLVDHDPFGSDEMWGSATLKPKEVLHGFEGDIPLQMPQGSGGHRPVLGIKVEVGKEIPHKMHEDSHVVRGSFLRPGQHGTHAGPHYGPHAGPHHGHQHHHDHHQHHGHQKHHRHDTFHKAQPYAAHQHQQSGSNLLKVSIAGWRQIRNATAYGSSQVVCVCEVPGKQRFESRISSSSRGSVGGHGPPNQIYDYCAGDPLNFSILDGQGCPLGGASLVSSQFMPYGYDAEVTIACPERGITGLLRVKIVVAVDGGYASRAGPPPYAPTVSGYPGSYDPRGTRSGPSHPGSHDPSARIGQSGRSMDARTQAASGRSMYSQSGAKRHDGMSEIETVSRGRQASDFQSYPATVEQSMGMSSRSIHDGRASQSGRYQSNHGEQHFDGAQSGRSQGYARSYAEEQRMRNDSNHGAASQSLGGGHGGGHGGDHGGGHAENKAPETSSFMGSMTGIARDMFRSMSHHSSGSQSKGGVHSSQAPSRNDGPKHTLKVHCISASDLRVADHSFIGTDLKSDPYVRIEIAGDEERRKATRKKTNYIKQDLNPTWNEVLEIEDYQVEKDEDLDIWVFDMDDDIVSMAAHAMGKEDDLLGRVTIGADDIKSTFGCPRRFDLMLNEAGDKQGSAKLAIEITLQ